MDAVDLFCWSILWHRYGNPDAGWHLVHAMHSGNPDIEMAATVLFFGPHRCEKPETAIEQRAA